MDLPKQLLAYQLGHYQQFQCILANATVLGDFLQHIIKVRGEAFGSHFRSIKKTGDEDAGRDKFYKHLFIWDDEQKCIACGIRFKFSGANNDESTSYLEKNYPGIYQYTDFDFIELGRAFIAPSHEDKPMLLLYMFSNLMSLILANNKHHRIIGTAAFDDRKNSNKANAFFFACLKNKYFAEQLSIPNATNQYQLQPVLSEEELSLASEISSMDEFYECVSKISDSPFQLSALLNYYLTIMNVKAVDLAIAPGFDNTIEILMHLDLAKMSKAQLEGFADSELVKDFLNVE